MNPVLPLQYFIPDVEARVWNDGRIYFYGSMDVCGDTTYCSHEYRVFSSADLIHFIDYGLAFKANGKNSNVSEGVATSTLPQGPFKNAVPVKGAHRDAIDPAVFVDDDGQVYYYWGQFHCRGAKLLPNMCSLDESSLVTDIINEMEHGFHEGASVRKRNGLYYLVYTDISRGRATCLAYATSSSPLGPYKKGGIIIDNAGCDPKTWNNHGSIAEFEGQWYVFYHRSSQNSIFNRRVCVEPIIFLDDGSIQEVEMTTQGVEKPLDASRYLDAGRACLLYGKVHAGIKGIRRDSPVHEEFLTGIEDGDWACYKYIRFDQPLLTFEIEAGSLKDGGMIEIRMDKPDGELIGTCLIEQTEGWENWKRFSCSAKAIEGVHTLYLVFKGDWGRLFDVKGFRFGN